MIDQLINLFIMNIIIGINALFGVILTILGDPEAFYTNVSRAAADLYPPEMTSYDKTFN